MGYDVLLLLSDGRLTPRDKSGKQVLSTVPSDHRQVLPQRTSYANMSQVDIDPPKEGDSPPFLDFSTNSVSRHVSHHLNLNE